MTLPATLSLSLACLHSVLLLDRLGLLDRDRRSGGARGRGRRCPAGRPGAPPVRAVLISDLHVAGPDMPPARLARIVAQVNALAPDIVLIAGDFVSDKTASTRHYSHAEAVGAAGRRSRPRLGVVRRARQSRSLARRRRRARARSAAARVRLLDNDGGAGRPARDRRARRRLHPPRRPRRDARARCAPAGRPHPAQPQPGSVPAPAARRRPDARRPHPLRPDPAAA